MSKRIKDLITQQYKQRYEEVDSGCLVSLVGLDAVSTNRLRGQLREKNLHMQVIRNRLAKRALKGRPLEPLTRGLEGSCALVHGGESVIDVAKTLVNLAKGYEALTLMTGLIDGDDELIPVLDLAKLKSKSELIGEVAMVVSSPGRALAGAMAGAGGRIAGCLKTIAERQ